MKNSTLFPLPSGDSSWVDVMHHACQRDQCFFGLREDLSPTSLQCWIAHETVRITARRRPCLCAAQEELRKDLAAEKRQIQRYGRVSTVLAEG